MRAVRWAWILLPTALVACKGKDPAPPLLAQDAGLVAVAPSASTTTTSTTDAALPLSVGDAGHVDASSVPVIDSPAWPAGATSLVLTWAAYPQAKDESRKVELVLRVGAVARRVDLPRKIGPLYCTARETNEEIARVGFSAGMGEGFRIEKHGDVLDVIEWATRETGDLHGGYSASNYDTYLARVPIPPGVAITARTTEIFGPNDERPFTACSPKP